MTTEQLLAQVISLVACFLSCYSYLTRRKSLFLLLQLACCAAFGAQYYLLGAFAALVNCGITAGKDVIFLRFEQKKKQCPLWVLLLFCMASAVGGVLTWDGLLSLIPMTTSLLLTLGIWQKRAAVLKCTFIVCALLWISYNLAVGAYVSVLYSVFELLFSVIALVRLFRARKDAR